MPRATHWCGRTRAARASALRLPTEGQVQQVKSRRRRRRVRLYAKQFVAFGARARLQHTSHSPIYPVTSRRKAQASDDRYSCRLE
eukprot:2925516-Prymnesium_polylepis.1